MSTNTSFSAQGLGTNQGSLSGGNMVVNGGAIIINGTLITSAAQGAMIPNIANISVSTTGGGAYTSRIDVVGACPSGAYDIKFEFTDATNDTYTLRIYSETTHTHSVYYNSSNPTIVGITWDA